MTTQYEQFLDMLANVKQMHPRVHGSKNIKLVHDSYYDVVEMASSAGRMIWGFSKETGELRDIIGPTLLPRQGQTAPGLRRTLWSRRRCFKSYRRSKLKTFRPKETLRQHRK
jgi:hypothetical protein